ncbi:MAG: DUF2089 domain-containing protein [Bacillota bacterium]
MRKALERCPTCSGALQITRMRCRDCHTQVESTYECCAFCRLSPASSEFLKVFVRSRGNIKEIERELGISYSSARSRLDDLIAELDGGAPPPPVARDGSPRGVLEALARGDIGANVALRLLEKSNK